MSQNGHPPDMVAPAGPTAMVFGVGTLPAGYWFDEHRHPQHQIAWAARGVLTVEVGGGQWVLPPTRALWIPDGTPHRTGTSEGAVMRGIFLEPDRCPVRFAQPTLLRVDRLLHEMFDYLTGGDTETDHATGDLPGMRDTCDADRRRRAEAVVFDLLEPVDVIPVGAPMPADPRARVVADSLLRDPADDRTLARFAPHAAASPRTLARLFLAETGITFGQWRTQIRLAASLPLLADGLGLARVAERVGYASPSAYVAAFRRAVGVSPGQYFAR